MLHGIHHRSRDKSAAAFCRVRLSRISLERETNLTQCRDIANTLNLSRLQLSDPQHLSDVFALYTHLYKKANILRSIPIDNGYPDAISINNLLRYVVFSLSLFVLLSGGGLSKLLMQRTKMETDRIDVLGIHFGYPGQTWFIDWEAYENIIQLVEANPVRLEDGTYRRLPGAVSFVTAIRNDFVSPFLQRLEHDRAAFQKSTSGKL